MSATRTKIEADIKAAMLARNEVARDTLRLVINDVKKAEEANGRAATEEDVMAALSSGAKRRHESIEQFDKAGRKDLADKEKIKNTILSIDNPAGPKGCKISKSADVTVVLYVDRTCKANFTFKKGELTEKDADKVIADLTKILPAK